MVSSSSTPWPSEGTPMARQSPTATPDPGNEPTPEYVYSNTSTNPSTATFYNMARAIASVGNQHRLRAHNHFGLAHAGITAYLSRPSAAFTDLKTIPAAPAAAPAVPPAPHTTDLLPAGTPRSVARFREPRVFDGKPAHVAPLTDRIEATTGLSQVPLPTDEDKILFLQAHFASMPPNNVPSAAPDLPPDIPTKIDATHTHPASSSTGKA